MNINYDDVDVTNPAPRCPVVLLLDVSGSMEHVLPELQSALEQFIAETANDEAARMSIELMIITFGSEVELLLKFIPVKDVDVNSIVLSASGRTPMGEALAMALQQIEERRGVYISNGIASYRPWIALMTDGEPTDEWEDAAEQAKNLASQNRLNFFGIGIGPYANMEILKQILPQSSPPLKLSGIKFKQFFRWLTDSLRNVTKSTVSAELGLNVTSWKQLQG
jgi:uncharacterized protein YegL